eukprot:2991215-Heterocapsa_arctica.AAC.1
MEPAGDVQTFIGLEVHARTGAIRVAAKRAWRLRLALLHLLEVGHCTGHQMRQLMGHSTWCALIRRPAL